MITETVLTYDFQRFSKDLLDALANNQVNIRDGVAYWKKGLEKTGIIQHIPFKEIGSIGVESFIQGLGSLQSTLQTTIVAAQAISTATLMVAMVVQTQILSKKIEAVQQCVLKVAQDINEQNILFYTDKTSEYLALLQTFKLLLDKRTPLATVNDLANNTLSSSIQLKNHLISFIGNLLSLVQAKKISSPQHIELILQFIQQMMEILPVGMHLEFILSHRLNHNEFSQVLVEDSHKQYLGLMSQYRSYLNEINNGLKEFRIKPEQVPFFETIKLPAKNLLQSAIHVELLEKPALEQMTYELPQQIAMIKA
ncbi:hypothetical protein [Acinetobacter rudis]|uniref:Chemotaxis protein n=1 Tax=Acinetobacter rudis TaxID=632955 RepID=A0AAW8J782_9GAMM|nr:hypothetical protein [Acinetobacter rudis]MDQ8935066.1 hypothetical protein [Acinetobacter rudis]MDQ9017379.1 hypothetical protein [Acinetobacter rudis]